MKCNIKAGDSTVGHLAFRFPALLNQFGYAVEFIDKVKSNLEVSVSH